MSAQLSESIMCSEADPSSIIIQHPPTPQHQQHKPKLQIQDQDTMEFFDPTPLVEKEEEEQQGKNDGEQKQQDYDQYFEPCLSEEHSYFNYRGATEPPSSNHEPSTIDSQTYQPQPANPHYIRSYNFEGINNFHDVGGYKTTDGKHAVKWNLMYRSARLDEATPKDVDIIMNELKIKTFIDLRNTSEIRFDKVHITITNNNTKQ